MLTGSGIFKSYGSLEVLKGVDLTVAMGEVVALVGSSGAGKSTLLQILGTLDKPDKGEVLFEGIDIARLKDKEQAAFRNETLGFVFQFHHLLPEFNALENVSIPALINGKSEVEAHKKAKELLDYFQLGDRLSHKPAQLSGGEQQRAAIARALVNNPRLILADEPTGNLDSANSEIIYKLIYQLAREFKVGFLIATHNEKYASSADRCLFIRDGEFV